MTDRHLADKCAAARAAVDRLASGMVVGLGTGSTAALAIEEIGKRLRTGALHDIVGIATSNAARHHALACGVPVGTLESHPSVDVTIDGADEIDPAGRVLKGHGGALLREKIVAARSARWIVVVDPTKLVPRLGTRFPVPVEVVPFGWMGHLSALRALGAEPQLRMRDADAPMLTDEGHYILDARFPAGIEDPEALAHALCDLPGVVDTGLFLTFRPEIIVGRADAA